MPVLNVQSICCSNLLIMPIPQFASDLKQSGIHRWDLKPSQALIPCLPCPNVADSHNCTGRRALILGCSLSRGIPLIGSAKTGDFLRVVHGDRARNQVGRRIPDGRQRVGRGRRELFNDLKSRGLNGDGQVSRGLLEIPVIFLQPIA